jgi:hypothetical protein
MALTATVTKKSVTYTNTTDFNIVFNLLVNDGATVVLNMDVSTVFDKTDTVPKKITEVTEKIQTEINKYKSSIAVFNSTALNNAVTSIQNGLTV